MAQDDWATRWRALSDEVLTELQDWRAAHPRATFAAIETEVESRLSRLRARMLEDAALATPAADLTAAAEAERPACPQCGHGLQARGHRTRRVTVRGDQTVALARSYAVCPTCGTGLFPPR
jgi:YgiT-type zinc finger domain-containing protein